MSAEAFRGELLRGGQWRGRDFGGQRVAVLAPGREAARIVPAVARTARAVKVFQEEPDWVLPLRLPRHLPLRSRVDRMASRLHLRLEVDDPWTRRLLTPDPRFNGRRPVTGPAFYPALQRPNCKLIAWPVYAIAADGVRTAEGVEHRVDCIVLGEESVFARELETTIPRREEETA